MVSFNGISINPTSTNNYDVVLKEGRNTFTLIPYEGMDEGEAHTYTVTFTKKTAEEGGSDSNQDLPTIQSSLDDITDGKVTNSPLSFMVYATDYQGNGIAPSQVTAQCNGVEYSQLWGDSGQVSYSVDLLENKVVLCVPEGSDKGIDSFDSLAEHLKAEDILFCMGNSDVPVGQYTQKILAYYALDEEALAAAGVITYGSNVKEVTTQITEASVDAGVVYCTDAYSAGLTPVDEATKEMCGQVIYPAAVLKAAPNAEAAREFLAYLQTDRAATVFESVGFTAL